MLTEASKVPPAVLIEALWWYRLGGLEWLRKRLAWLPGGYARRAAFRGLKKCRIITTGGGRRSRTELETCRDLGKQAHGVNELNHDAAPMPTPLKARSLLKVRSLLKARSHFGIISKQKIITYTRLRIALQKTCFIMVKPTRPYNCKTKYKTTFEDRLPTHMFPTIWRFFASCDAMKQLWASSIDDSQIWYVVPYLHLLQNSQKLGHIIMK